MMNHWLASQREKGFGSIEGKRAKSGPCINNWTKLHMKKKKEWNPKIPNEKKTPNLIRKQAKSPNTFGGSTHHNHSNHLLLRVLHDQSTDVSKPKKPNFVKCGGGQCLIPILGFEPQQRKLCSSIIRLLNPIQTLVSFVRHVCFQLYHAQFPTVWTNNSQIRYLGYANTKT